jgi:hypothetical protein
LLWSLESSVFRFLKEPHIFMIKGII